MQNAAQSRYGDEEFGHDHRRQGAPKTELQARHDKWKGTLRKWLS